MPPPAFSEVGKACSSLLNGSPASGAFVFDPKVTYTGATSCGLSFTTTAVVKKEGKVDATLKAAWSSKKCSGDATLDPAGKLAVSTALLGVAPGLKLSTSFVVPDPSSAKLIVEYGMPYLNIKSNVGLTSSPEVGLIASTAYKNVVLGADCTFDTAKSAVSKWNAGVGYHAADFQVAAFLNNKASDVKLTYSQVISPKQSIGAEIVRKLASNDTTYTVGYSRLLDNGALTKVKIDNVGLLSVLYETKLSTGEKLGTSVQFQATDLAKPVKYGFALSLC